jgi:hypothetical protein
MTESLIKEELKKEDVKLIKHLKEMISNHDTLFVEDLAKIICEKLGQEKLKNSLIPLNFSYYTTFHTSIWGYIVSKYAFNTYPSKSLEDYKKEATDSYRNATEGEKNYNYAIAEYNKNEEIVKNWNKLLSNISPDLVKDPQYILQLEYNPQSIGFNGWFILKHADKWASCYLENSEKWKLTEEEEKVFCHNLLSSEQSYNLSRLEYEKKHAEGQLLLDLFIKNQEQLKKEVFASSKAYGKMSEIEKEDEWIEQMFGSKSFKHLLEIGEPEKISALFPLSALKKIIDRSNLNKNVKENSEMLSNLLPLAPPEQWIKAYSIKGKFNINTFFEEKFKRGYRVSLLKGKYKQIGGYVNAKKAVLEELSYLKPALKTASIKEDDLLNFWEKILKANDVNLFKQVAKIFSLPEENEKNKNFYENFDGVEITEYDNNGNTQQKLMAREWYKVARYEELQESLEDKVLVKKKLKI